MLTECERVEIDRLWARKLEQDAQGIPQTERHRNLEPDSAEFIHALAMGIQAQNIVEIGGSSGISTIVLASAAKQVEGRLTSFEIEPVRQSEARETIQRLGLGDHVEFVCADATEHLPTLTNVDLALIDCEKDDYIRFFNMLQMSAGGIIVADNIISHGLTAYLAHVRAHHCVESITLPIGKGLEITRFKGARLE